MTARRPVGTGLWALCGLLLASCRDQNEPALELSTPDAPLTTPGETAPAAFPSLGGGGDVLPTPPADPARATGEALVLRGRVSRFVLALLAGGAKEDVEARAGIRLQLEPDSDRGAAHQLALGECDLALVVGPLTGRDQERGLLAQQLGTYVMAVVVHPQNPVRSVSATALQQLLTGTLRDWSQLGAPPCPVQVFALPVGDALDARNLSLVLPADSLPPDVVRVPQTGAICRSVQNARGGLGIVPLGVALAGGNVTQLLAVDGVTPSQRNAVSGVWSYNAPVVLAIKSAHAVHAERLADGFKRSAAWRRALGP